MTPAVSTPIFPSPTLPPEVPGGDAAPACAPGEFADLVDQAVNAPNPQGSGGLDHALADNGADTTTDDDTDDPVKKPASAQDKDALGPQTALCLTVLAPTVVWQPLTSSAGEPAATGEPPASVSGVAVSETPASAAQAAGLRNTVASPCSTGSETLSQVPPDQAEAGKPQESKTTRSPAPHATHPQHQSRAHRDPAGEQGLPLVGLDALDGDPAQSDTKAVPGLLRVETDDDLPLEAGGDFPPTPPSPNEKAIDARGWDSVQTALSTESSDFARPGAPAAVTPPPETTQPVVEITANPAQMAANNGHQAGPGVTNSKSPMPSPDATDPTRSLESTQPQRDPAPSPTAHSDSPASNTASSAADHSTAAGTVSGNPENRPMPAPRSDVAFPDQIRQQPQVAEPENGQNRPVFEGGMPDASQTGNMQAKREMDETAYSTGQNLPTVVAAEATTRPAGRGRKSSPAALDRPLSPPAASAEATTVLDGRPVERALDAASDVSKPQNGVVEVVRKAIESATSTFQRMDAHSLSMMLKPDANTQLALHVKWQQGRYEALAVLERGDLGALGAEWSQLQNRLAEHGVRLAPLVCGLHQQASFAGSHFSSPKNQREFTPPGDAPAPVMNKAQTRRAAATPVRAGRGREWWA